jgi:YVTN family beta-propeller protein
MRANNFLRASAIILVMFVVTSDALSQKVGKTAKVGAGLYEIVYSEKAKAIYVASIGKRGEQGTAKIYKLDPDTLETQGAIDVSAAPAFGLGLNEKTQTLYASNTRSNSVSAIDLKSGKIIATITSGQDKSHTREVLVDEEANKIYVSNMTDVWVIDGATNKFSHLIENLGEMVTGVALNKKKQLLYATNMRADKLSVVDLKTNKVVNSFASGGKTPINVFFEAKSSRLFVVNQGSGELIIMDESGKVLQTIATGEGALSVNFNPTRNLIYVANRQAGTTSIIDGGSYKVIASLKTGTFPQTIAIDQKSGKVYITNKAAGGRRGPADQQQPPPPDDPNGDVITIIEP